MNHQSKNFSFLAGNSPDLDRLHLFALQAEMYLHSDPNTTLIKIRQFGELLAQEIAARNGEFREHGEKQDILLRRLKSKGFFNKKIDEFFHEIRKDGNLATHKGLSDSDRALKALKYAHELARWFYRSYFTEKTEKKEIPDFIQPSPLLDLKSEFEKLQQQLSEYENRAEIEKAAREKTAERARELQQLLKIATQEQKDLIKKQTQEEIKWQEILAISTQENAIIIEKYIEENIKLQELLKQEIQERNQINEQLEQLQSDALKLTTAAKQATIIRSHQQEEKIRSVMEVDALEINSILRSRYKILEHLSSGSFGVTYKAEDLDSPSGKLCVIKQFNPIDNDPNTVDIARDRFNKEAEVLEKLAHECIPKFDARFEEQEQSYIVQELVEGIPLSQELSTGEQRDEPFIRKLLKDILTPLAYVHSQDIIHRDLKPDNLIRRKDGKISLIDFGAVKEVVNQNTSQRGTTIGTPSYMPSEQEEGRAKPSSDIYAVGTIAIEAATGVIASELSRDSSTENIIWEDLAPQISHDLKTILSRMVQYYFKDRYQSAVEALEAVEKLELLSSKDSKSSESNKIVNAESSTFVQANIEPIVEKPQDKSRIDKDIDAESSTPTVANIEPPTSTAKDERQAKHNSTGKPWGKIIVGAILGIGIVSLGIKSWGYFTKAKIATNNITIGIITNPVDYRELQEYLRQEFVPANYFDYLIGKQVGITIEGDPTLEYKEVKQRITDKKWDIAFARSPMISRFAQKQGYSYLAAMFPGSPTYKAGIFVKANSPIKSIDDIKPNTVVALGSFNSASSFYIPAYDLYGKTFLLARNNRLMKMVKEGKVEVGAAAIGDRLKPNDPEFRIIHTSRDIPGSGVYLSPRLAPEYQKIKQVLLAAPKNIRDPKKANYGNAPEPNYQEFDKITDRVDSIIECVDFKKNPVRLFCDRSNDRANTKIQ